MKGQGAKRSAKKKKAQERKQRPAREYAQSKMSQPPHPDRSQRRNRMLISQKHERLFEADLKQLGYTPGG